MTNPTKSVQYQFFQNEKIEQVDAQIIVEAPVSLTINGENWLTFMCTPIQLDALAVGFLFNEGVIASLDEVADLRVCENNENVDVWLTHSAEKPKHWMRTSGCGGGQTTGGTNLNPGLADRQNDVVLKAEQIPSLLAMLDDEQSLYRLAGGVHTSVLSDGTQRILAAEDIGRHNTLDKLAGQMLLNGSKPNAGVILTTGRISSEMMQKSIRLGASVVISRTSPSSMSVELAEKQGITLIGYAKRHRFNLYTHPERLNVKTEQL